MDDNIANPCYVLLGITGVGMVQVAGYPWSLKWIHGGLALLLLMAVLGFARLHADAAQADCRARGARPERSGVPALSKRGAMVGGILGLIVLGIVALMVFKPV